MKHSQLFAAILAFSLIVVSTSAAPQLQQIFEPKRSILLGSWTGEVEGFTEVWTFKDDGTISIETKTKDGERQNLSVGKWYLKYQNLWTTITEQNGQAVEERERQVVGHTVGELTDAQLTFSIPTAREWLKFTRVK